MHAMEAKGGCLTVSLEPFSIGSRLETLCGPCEPGESIQLSVADTGTGIEPKLIERLIDPFFTTKEVGKGTGLGLAMVHGIVKSMGGGLLIESELGSGTKVRVIFPLVPENQVSKNPKEPPRPQGSGAGNVMIVDDEEAITKLTALMLESRGFTVDSFNDSSVALEALKVAPMAYDVALLDFTMPGRTGGDLAREFQALAAEMPVILATGHIDELEREQTSSPNIVDIIKKPFDIDALVSAINRSR
jgi:CheY-like chemotaxis protein